MEKPYLYDSALLPSGFQYPQSFLDFIAQEDVSNIFPWKFICYCGKERADGWKEELERLYPTRKLIPFAHESGTDDCACFDAATPSSNPLVYFVHAYASPGWEDRGYAHDFSEWLTMVEEVAAAWRQSYQEEEGRDGLEARLKEIRSEAESKK
jgi:hypothetical protein